MILESKQEELRHFLEFEIELTRKRIEEGKNPMYDGVYVGNKKAKALKERHIKFCERLLKMI